jgi:hypothetical protein
MPQQQNFLSYDGTGYLINLIRMHPETFNMHGIRGFVDDHRFRCGAGFYPQ